LLLSQIDKYYTRAFDKGLIKAKMIYPTGEKKTFTKEDKAVLREFVKSKLE
jgi:hypothetical protein